jgi:chemotaxis protein MotB
MNKPGVGQDKPADELTDEELRDEMAARDEEAFKEVENTIRQAMDDIPELKKLKDHLIIDQTPEGLRIQIVDQQKQSMFELGSAEMIDRTDTLLRLVARVVQDLPNKLSLRGHTDSTPFGAGAQYTNWELSADRANASRRVLEDAGIKKERIANVIGKADKDPLIADDPASPINRRISIILLREGQSGEAKDTNQAAKTVAEEQAEAVDNLDLIDTSNPGASKIFESDKPIRFGDTIERRD